MNLCRFQDRDARTRIGLVADDSQLVDLSAAGMLDLESVLESEGLVERLKKALESNLPRRDLGDVKLQSPIERQEVWAAGVTYLRSKTARMEESDFSASAYDRVYSAARPELFFKALPEKVVATGETVGVRRDARWSVPEPELALVLNSAGKVVGYTIGNDMSSRDIEGENLLYLPQAKIYSRSCALGPWIRVGASEPEARQWTIGIRIEREGQTAFSGQTSVGQIKRSFEELAGYLFRSQQFPHGAVLLTGTGIVPPDDFTLQAADRIQIQVSGIGVLCNSVIIV